MKLPQRIEINLPGRNGQTTTRTLDDIPLIIIDDSRRKVVLARLWMGKPIVLWEGSAYDEAGDYTQAQAERRIMELLGPDLKSGIEGLLSPAPNN